MKRWGRFLIDLLEYFLEETLAGNLICTAGLILFLYAIGVMMKCVG